MNWTLHTKEGKKLSPLQFSNGKDQAKIVDEVLQSIKDGHKVIFIKGMCGSGKSSIALHLAKALGKTSIVVPVKFLQHQYEEDYSRNMYISKDNGDPLRIMNLTGRNNFSCIYNKGCGADDRFIPCTIDLKKENWDLIKVFLQNNPNIKAEKYTTIEDVRRLHVAAACPHWSPVIGKEWFGDYGLGDAKQYNYKGLENNEYIYYQRKPGCSYYEQFKSYVDADVLIFNNRKYEIETNLNRKPETEIEIIDECDEFLDNLSNEKRINLDYMLKKISEIIQANKDESLKLVLLEIRDLVEQLRKSKWLDEVMENKDILKLVDTKVNDLLIAFLKNDFLLEYEELESYYHIAKSFEGLFKDTYITFSRNQTEQIILHIVNINLEQKLKELVKKNKVFVMMSGTLHSETVLKNIFGINEFHVIEAETQHQGTVKKWFTGLEKNYRYRAFKNGIVTRKDYLESLQACVENAKKPFLVHINSYNDLPSDEEKEKYGLNIMSRERLRSLQDKYRQGELLQMFKDKKIDVLYSTKCNRGVDFPGDMCNSIIFTRYPFPDMQDIFWKILREQNPDAFKNFYFDKARREFLQRVYRGLRRADDTLELLSPDTMVMQQDIQ